MSTITRVLRPFTDRASLARLAFLFSALPLAGVWLGMLIVVWVLVLVLAITPLVVPALMGLALAVRVAANVEAALAGTLLDVELRLPAARRSRGFWARAWAVLADPFVWRAQAYLLLRLTVGFAIAIALLATIAVGAFLIVAPTFYWTTARGIGPDAYRVHTFLEALTLVPAGLILLLAIAHLLEPLAAGWRTLSSALLARRPATTHTQDSSPREPPAGELRGGDRMRGAGGPDGARALRGLERAVAIHAATVGGLSLLLTIIWALTSRGYFWPVWPMLAFGLALAIHAWVVWVGERRGFWLDRRLDRGFAINAGVWGALLLFLTGVWAASGGGYFWPVWPLLAGVLVLGAHATALLLRSPDRTALAARISTLESTRAGAVDVQDAELRRIERDLHDGAQARLVALGMSLGMAEQKMATDTDAARELLAEARTGAGEALRELRDLARGIHPPVLADRGLDAAVRALAAVSPISVTVSVVMSKRPRAPVESAAYFVVAEGLANAGKHARATRIDVRIVRDHDELSVEIHDDGVGGADRSGGGLGGLRRRVEALDGTLAVISPSGGPTTIRAELPCG